MGTLEKKVPMEEQIEKLLDRVKKLEQEQEMFVREHDLTRILDDKLSNKLRALGG